MSQLGSRYWACRYHPVRAFWLTRGVSLLLALDTLLLMLEQGGRYGVGGFNVAHFAWVTPAVFESASGTGQYGSRTFVQRMATDLSRLSETTSSAIDRSDLRMQSLLALVALKCQANAPVIVAGSDWRRVMWYLPDAAAIDMVNDRPFAIARHTDALPIADAGEELHTSCPVIWLASDRSAFVTGALAIRNGAISTTCAHFSLSKTKPSAGVEPSCHCPPGTSASSAHTPAPSVAGEPRACGRA